MNWKLRFKNKTTLVTLIAAAVALVYQVLGLFNVVPSVSEESVMNIATMGINLLCILGIVVDPTTPGIADSDRAMTYDKPGGDE